MPTSLHLPTVSRLIDQLDGAEPGSSLLDLVAARPGDKMPSVAWESLKGKELRRFGELRTVSFYGSIRDASSGTIGDIAFESTVCCRNGYVRPEIPKKTELRVRIKETGSSATLYVMKDARDSFGGTTVQAFSEFGRCTFPIFGHPHPVTLDSAAGPMSVRVNAQRSDPDSAVRLSEIIGGRMFLARMYLNACIRGGHEELTLFPYIMTVPFDLELVLQRNIGNTDWGD